MNTKLTLRLDEKLIKSAKIHAHNMGKSVSQMVADYFYYLDRKDPPQNIPLTPIVKSLRGVLKNSGVDEKDYRSYIEKKHL